MRYEWVRVVDKRKKAKMLDIITFGDTRPEEVEAIGHDNDDYGIIIHGWAGYQVRTVLAEYAFRRTPRFWTKEKVSTKVGQVTHRLMMNKAFSKPLPLP